MLKAVRKTSIPLGVAAFIVGVMVFAAGKYAQIGFEAHRAGCLSSLVMKAVCDTDPRITVWPK